MNTPASANDNRPGFWTGIFLYALLAPSIMLPMISVFCLVFATLARSFKAGRNIYLLSHIRSITTTCLVILAFNILATIGVNEAGVIVTPEPAGESFQGTTPEMGQAPNVFDQDAFQRWLPAISVTFMIYLLWTGSRLVSGLRLLRKDMPVMKTRYLGTVLSV